MVNQPVLLSVFAYLNSLGLLREFSGGSTERVINFFRELRAALPEAAIVLGEITALPPSFLARHHESSILPELLLFHSLSGQGVLEWETWHRILDEIPYSLAASREFDLVGGGDEDAIPSSFVWHLKPK